MDSPEPLPPGWRRRETLALALLILLPVAVTLANPDSPFSPLYHDCWLYHGYFVDLPGHLKTFSHLYYSSRLSITLPGWLAFRVLPPLPANHVLHLGVYLVSVLSLYFIVRRAAGFRAALLAGILLGGHFFFHQAVASDYIDGYGIAYFLLCAALLSQAAVSDRWRIWLFLAGGAAIALVVVNIAFGLLLAPLAGHHYLANRQGRQHPLDAGGFWLGLGGLATFGLFAAASKAAGGPAWFLAPSFAFAQAIKQQAVNPFKLPLREWLPHAGWLLWPGVAALGAIVCLVRRQAGSALTVWHQVQFLGVGAFLLWTESRPTCAMLQIWFYAGAFLIPLAFLALAGQWHGWLETLSPRAFAWLVGCALLLATGSAGLPPLRDMVPPVAALALLATVAGLLPTLRPGLATGIAALVFLAAADAGIRQRFRIEQTMTPASVANLRLDREGDFIGRRRSVFESIHSGMRQARKLDPAYGACYWYDIDEPLGLVFDNIACLHCWGQRLVNTTFPDTKARYIPLRADMDLLFLSADPGAEPRLEKALRGVGLRGDVVTRAEVGEGAFGYTIRHVRTRRDLSAQASGADKGGS